VSETATIRVPKDTRDRLLAVAERRGVSVSKLVTELAAREHVHAIYDAEREAWSLALSDPDFAEELRDWDEALLDGSE
jgi:predicted DNA-binding protein